MSEQRGGKVDKWGGSGRLVSKIDCDFNVWNCDRIECDNRVDEHDEVNEHDEVRVITENSFCY